VITRADRAREAGDWTLAARLSVKALARSPGKSPIWVQYGHVLKEAGRLDEAQAAYRRGIYYDPQAADPYLHLGHALKLQGRPEEAESAYISALALDPSSPDAAIELVAFGWDEDRIAPLRRAAHFPTALPPAAGSNAGHAPLRVVGRRRDSVITLADRARDAGDWILAAQLYQKALARKSAQPADLDSSHIPRIEQRF
jgi:tetratricopeptide (TPR) repeat protein